ncbi:MAG: M20/M25/M40 family metallo-hydrolase, partial [Bacteroidota bacterium]
VSHGVAGEADTTYQRVARELLRTGLSSCQSYGILDYLTTNAGRRLSGSPGADRAVKLAVEMMLERRFQKVHAETVMVPRWVRGNTEEGAILSGESETPVSVCALGMSVATPEEGITAQVVEVQSLEEARSLGEKARGRIVFFNRPFDPTHLNTFEGYGGAVDQRGGGAVAAARSGGVAALVRAVTPVLDEVPHTGWMGYEEGVPQVPGAAISTADADILSAMLKEDPDLRVRIRLSCASFADVPSFNVMGELTGTEHPEEVIVLGAHLDSWDLGTGAHDDGAGCAHAIQALHLLRKLGIAPKRTIRAVLFTNEENGSRGGPAYVADPRRRGEKHIAAIESDRGGFAPRGVAVQADSAVLAKVLRWRPLFDGLLAGEIRFGHGGSDITPLVQAGTAGFGLLVESHRYFDYQHSEHDTIDKVHPRELEMGAIVEALLAYLISEEGL